MNNIFDIKRFGNYFLYDLRRAKNNYGISLLIMGLTPVLLLVIHVLLSLLSGNGVNPMGDATKEGGIVVILLSVMIGAGVKLYGFLTEKRAGSDFLMFPASTFEKWLSIVLMVCIIIPAVILALLFASDFILSLVLPGLYGGRAFDQDLVNISQAFETEGVTINYGAIIFISWCQNVLFFTLGAILFKNAKVAKSLLCMMGIGMLLSTILVIIVGHRVDFDISELSLDFPEKAINWAASIWYAVSTGLLLWGIWYRLRTLKH